MSAFTTVVGRLGDLSELELRQLHSIVAIRLGLPEGGSTRRAGGPAPNKGGKGSKGSNPKGQGGQKASSKGNPSRKSQWETHPLYKEYKRLKKTVETQAAEMKISFAAVDTPERTAYNEALANWLAAKSSFRGRSGPEKEGAEESSAKDKEKPAQAAPGATGAVASGSSSGNAGVASWADEAQEAMDVDDGSGSDSESDAGDEVQVADKGKAPAGDERPKRGASKASIPSRSTPPKKSSAGSKPKH